MGYWFNSLKFWVIHIFRDAKARMHSLSMRNTFLLYELVKFHSELAKFTYQSDEY